MSFQPWHVYVVDVSTIEPPKPKLCLCFHGGPPPLFFFINTHPWLPASDQFRISPAEHPALTHDSFIDLSAAREFSPLDLQTCQPRGPLAPDTLGRIDSALRLVQALPERHRRLALGNL